MNTERMMSCLIVSLAAFLLVSCGKQEQKMQQKQQKKMQEPEKLWSTQEGIDGPESVYYHPETDRLYVSNMAGGSTDQDGNGWISILEPDGTVVEKKWVDGLHAPKGIRIHDGTLWVTDIDHILGFDLESGEEVVHHTVENAEFLNDVAIGPDGTVYVSDRRANKIYRVKEGEYSVIAEGEQLENPNGLLVNDGRLYVGGWSGHLYSLDLNGEDKQLMTEQPLGNLDGLELDGHGGYLVSDWKKGTIFRVTGDGKAQTILELELGTADIGYIHESRTLLIPHNKQNKIIAYKLPRNDK